MTRYDFKSNGYRSYPKECPNPHKRGFRSKRRALEIASKSTGKLWTYKCECREWHLTSQDPKRKKRPLPPPEMVVERT